MTEVAAKFGKTYSLDLRYKVLGAPELDGARMVVNELKLPISVEEYISMVRAFESKVMSDVDILPGSYNFYFLQNRSKQNNSLTTTKLCSVWYVDVKQYIGIIYCWCFAIRAWPLEVILFGIENTYSQNVKKMFVCLISIIEKKIGSTCLTAWVRVSCVPFDDYFYSK